MGISKENNCSDSNQDAVIRSLIEQVKARDQAAFAKLLEMFEPLIASLVNKMGDDLSAEDKEELSCEATLGLYNAALGYDSMQEEVGFGLYAKICIKNRIATACRAYRKRDRIRTVSIEGITTDDEELSFPGSVVDDSPAASVIAEERLEHLRYIINTVLSAYESRIWWMHVSGLSVKEIASREASQNGETADEKRVRSINNALYRIRAKLKASLANTEGQRD